MTSPAEENTPSTLNDARNDDDDAVAAADSSVTDANNNNNKSALQDNIERKGKNAYYYAHGHKVNGPAWDGKAEPRLLSRQESATCSSSSSTAGHLVSAATQKKAFDYHKSNITSYAFMDDGMKVKLYISLPGVGEKCNPDNDISLDYTETSFSLIIRNYSAAPSQQQQQEHCLQFGKLTAEITNATFRLKPDKVIVTLNKAREGVWHTINDKGAPDHEVV